jgi:hypothetical protein
MGRAVLPVIETAIASTEFKFFDWVQLTLPMKAGDGMPILICAAKARFLMQPIEELQLFIVETYLTSLTRMPTEMERDNWVAVLQPLLDAGDTAGYFAEVRSRISDIFTGGDYEDLERSDYQFLSDVYSTYYQRAPLADERTGWVGESPELDRPLIVNALSDSAEFQRRLEATANPSEFMHDVKSMSEIVINEGRAMDNVDVVLTNRDGLYSERLTEVDRMLTPTRAIVGRAFYIGTEIFVHDVLMIGNVQFNDINLAEVKLTINSDMSRQGIKVIRELTQRCSHIYKGPGCDTNDPSPTCSRIKTDAVNGCKSKQPAPMLDETSLDNRPRFGGIAKLAPNPPTRVGDGGGWGQGPIDPRNPIQYPTFSEYVFEHFGVVI